MRKGMDILRYRNHSDLRWERLAAEAAMRLINQRLLCAY